jgi:hypothetical protein
MSLSRRAAVVIGAALSAATLTLALGLPVQAATAGWHVAFTHHYGSPANASGYLTVIAPGSHDAWAFGGTDLSGVTPGAPVAEHWNGKTWSGSTLPHGPSTPIEAASAASAGDIWAVTHFGGYILHWNGAWSVAKKLSGSGQLTGVTAFSTSNVWVFGGGGFIGGLGTWHYNGKTWKQMTGNASGLDHASALSPSNIWAIGGISAPQNAIMHYNGTTWAQVKASALSGLQFHDVLALSQKDIWVASSAQANSFSASLVHFTGTGWTRIKLPWLVDPERLASDGHGGLWLTALDTTGHSWAAHRSASGQWSRTLIGSSASLLDPAHIPGTASMWGAGLVNTKTGANAAIWAYGPIP